MPHVTTQQAADLAGKNRTTIWRACKSGKLSATKDGSGDFLIDPAELERVYGTLRNPQPRNQLQKDALHPPATSNETSTLQTANDLLRERIRDLERDKDDLRTERDRLLGVIEEQAGSVRLLTDQRADRSPRSWPPGWWRRLRGS